MTIASLYFAVHWQSAPL